MSDLVTFLRARLDEDEAGAKAATPGPWRVRSRPAQPGVQGIDAGDYDEVVAPGSVSCGSYCYGGSSSVEVSAEDAAHIARHDPASVLADIAAKRAIIDGYETEMFGPWDGCGDDCEWKAIWWVLTQFAKAYAGHPDYQETWTT